jgi:pimeloyl-ACP methyl ester carboxylesterase
VTKWLRRIALGAVSLVAVAVLSGATYEALARASAGKAFPPPGRLVDIGGRRIQLDCRGAGTPVVVFESGLDTLGSLSWARVEGEAAETTRACAYSRAGLMWSDPAGRPFTSLNAAEDLHKALAAAGERPPYVLVGHSLGGPYALVFTGRYGADVAGLVFVDASHPDQVARMRAAIGKDLDSGGLSYVKTVEALAWTGLVRLAASSGGGPVRFGKDVAGPYAAWLPQSLPAAVAEGGAMAETLATAGRERMLGDRPLVVLTHGAKTTAQALQTMKLTAAQGARFDAEWLVLQDEEARWSTRSRHEVVPGATHYIQMDRPQAVIDAVRYVVEEVRQGESDLRLSPPQSASVVRTPSASEVTTLPQTK